MSPDELAAVLAEHDNAPLYCPICPPHYGLRNCLPYQLAELASEQAAALSELMQTPSDGWLIAAIAWDAGRRAALRDPDETNPYADEK